MKKLLYLLLLYSGVAHAQFIEFGGGLGAMNYTGDLNTFSRISSPKLAAQGIYRLNFSEIVSLKFGLTVGKIVGDDTNPRDALGTQRNFSFEHSLIEFSTAFEYHFFDYRTQDAQTRWSPYITLGFGITKVNNVAPTFEDFNPLQPVIPMGAGVKFLVGKRFSLAVETGARKTFFDYLDGISDGDTFIKDYQFGNPNDQDWYFYSGISLTYVLYNIPCPFPYIPNKSIFSRIRAY